MYLRTSSDENQKPELSRARQRMLIYEQVLKRSDMTLIDEYSDVLTGTSPERDDYQRMLEDARAGKFSHVIVERPDRFGRNDTEALRAIDELAEFGVAVRFADQPELDPLHPDDRVFVALKFTLARRESEMLGIRVVGGLAAKREIGGYCGIAPDGYLNIEEKVTQRELKKRSGRLNHWIEPDPKRAPIIRYAFDLLLEDRYTLAQICEKLHERGYRYKSGRAFVEVKKNGKRKVNDNTLSAIFHNWTYAGWLTSKTRSIPPKTIRGDWEPIVTTEEMEQVQAILARRNVHRIAKRKHDYLLKDLIYYEEQPGQLEKLTCSTPNASREYGGTPYYSIPSSRINWQCSHIDPQIGQRLRDIQVAPEHVAAIRAVYTEEVARKLGHLKPDEKAELEAALKAVDNEEARAMRMYAAGMMTETVYEDLWQEWQDRRTRLRAALDGLKHQNEAHIANLDTALRIIAQVGNVYNELERGDQKELLRQMVERVIVNPKGEVRLELHAPFEYLRGISDTVRSGGDAAGGSEQVTANKKTARANADGLEEAQRSDCPLLCGENRIRTCDPALPPDNRLAGGPIRPLWHLPLYF